MSKPSPKSKAAPKKTYPQPKGRQPTIEWVPVDQLWIDDTYQRSTSGSASQRLIDRIATDWDWDLFDLLKVSLRPDGDMYVVDGQHRTAAAMRRKDIQQLPCVVKRCNGPAEEARLFVAANRGRKPMSVLDDFRAVVSTGSPRPRAARDRQTCTIGIRRWPAVAGRCSRPPSSPARHRRACWCPA